MERLSLTRRIMEIILAFSCLKIKLFGQTGDFKSVEVALKKSSTFSPQEPGYRKLLINFSSNSVASTMRKPKCEPCGRRSREFGDRVDLIRFLYTIKQAPAAARKNSMPASTLGERFSAQDSTG